MNQLTVFQRFTGNGELVITEKEDGLHTSIKDFSFKTSEDNFNFALNADLNIPLSFDDLINKPKDSDFNFVSSFSFLKIGNFTLKPFSLDINNKDDSTDFSIKSITAKDFPYVKLDDITGNYNEIKKDFSVKFKTLLNLGKENPNLSLSLKPIDIEMKLTKSDSLINIELKHLLPKSTLSYKSEGLSLSSSFSHNSIFNAEIPIENFLKSKILSFKTSSSFELGSLKTNRLEAKELKTELILNSDKEIGLHNYLDFNLNGKLNSALQSISLGLVKANKKEMSKQSIPQWKEGLKAENISVQIPFNWNPRLGFKKNFQNISLASVNHFRWVDGGDFLGFFPKQVGVENINLKSNLEGLQLSLNETVSLNKKLKTNINFKSGWQIPREVLSGSKSPLTFLAQIALEPTLDLKALGSIVIEDAEITDLADFIKEPISDDNILIGKVSAKVDFIKDRHGLKTPAVFELKNTRAYIVKEDDSFIKAKGLRGRLKLESLLDFKSADSQFLRIDDLEAPGLKLKNTLLKYKIYSPEKIRIMRLGTSWCGGKIEGADILFNPAHKSLSCTIFASKVEMEEVMELMKGVECKANGSLYGRMSIELRNGKITNQDGFLFSEPGTKMSLQMQGENVIYNSITDAKTKKLLSDLDVEYFKILFKGGADMNEHKTVFAIKGVSAVGDPPNPLDLSINFNGPVIYYLQLPLHEKAIKEFIQNKAKEIK